MLEPLKRQYDDPMDILVEYLKKVDGEGVGRFCIRVQGNDANTCHRVVRKCPFHDFHLEAGTPELTRIFCETDIAFYGRSFPAFTFHRNGSWENTIAYGKEECEFVFDRKHRSGEPC
jgi:hypothetical protein